MKKLHNYILMLVAVAIIGLGMGTAFFERAPMVVKAAEPDPIHVDAEPVSEGQEVEITFQVPEGWQGKEAKIGIGVTDKNNTGQLSVAKVESRISEEGEWNDITSSMEVTIKGNGSLYIRVTDQKGETYTQNRYVECFDKTKPTLSAVAKDGVLIVQGADAESGVAAIYVNGNEFTELKENTLYIRLQQADTSYQQFTLQVRDHVGNVSENYKVANPYYENPETKKQAATENSGETATNQLPTSGEASKPTNATGTVTAHQTATGTSAEDTSNGATSSAKGKEFYTIQTKGDKVFYLIVDKDKSSDNVYLLTEVGENDLLNFSDRDMVTLPQNNAVSESALPVTIEEKEKNGDALEKAEEKDTKKADTKEASGNKGTYILMAVVLVAIGAVYYLKVVRGKRNSFEDGYDEEDDEEDEEDEMEVYGDDDFEDKEVEEDTNEEEEYM